MVECLPWLTCWKRIVNDFCATFKHAHRLPARFLCSPEAETGWWRLLAATGIRATSAGQRAKQPHRRTVCHEAGRSAPPYSSPHHCSAVSTPPLRDGPPGFLAGVPSAIQPSRLSPGPQKAAAIAGSRTLAPLSILPA